MCLSETNVNCQNLTLRQRFNSESSPSPQKTNPFSLDQPNRPVNQKRNYHRRRHDNQPSRDVVDAISPPMAGTRHHVQNLTNADMSQINKHRQSETEPDEPPPDPRHAVIRPDRPQHQRRSRKIRPHVELGDAMIQKMIFRDGDRRTEYRDGRKDPSGHGQTTIRLAFPGVSESGSNRRST